MKKSSLAIVLSALAVSTAVAADKECPTVSTTVKTEVSAKPQDVLTVVAAQIAANPTCACEIVKAAIEAAKADKDLVGQIVFTAVTSAPAEATTIAECAVAASPEASENIKTALQRAMYDGKNSVAKNPKGPVGGEVIDDTADFGLSPVAIGGVYLIYPSSSGSGVRFERRNGRLVIIGPDGRRFVDEDTVIIRRGRPTRPPQGGVTPEPTPDDGAPVVIIPNGNS